MMYGCPFCAEQFLLIQDQACHLVNTHPSVRVDGSKSIYLEVYLTVTAGHRVRCFCEEFFSCNRERTPLFTLLGHFVPEPDSFTAHLRREGGLEKHLAWLKDQELLRIVAGEVASETTTSKKKVPKNIESPELYGQSELHGLYRHWRLARNDGDSSPDSDSSLDTGHGSP